MATPTIVQGVSGFAAAGVTTYSVTIAAAGAGHAVVLCAAGDKDVASYSALQAGTDVDVFLRSASVSLVIAWYVAVGGETVISGTVGANIAGANLFALEIEQDGDTGDWQLVAVASTNSTEVNVSAQATGDTGAAIADGLAIAAVACDSVNTAGTASWALLSYTARYSSANGSTQAGLWVATNPVAAGATTGTTLTRAGGTPDQHSGGVIVLGKVAAAATPGVPFLVDELGDDATLLVEIAFGADVLGDPTVWPWTEVTTDVRATPGISTTLGRGDEASTSQPATLQLVLDNTSGDYNLGGEGAHWPYVRQGTPVRVTIDPDDLGGGRVVMVAFAAGWVPGWDEMGGRIPVVTLTAAGSLRRIEQGRAPVASALRRALALIESVKAYWPMEDGRDATVLAAVEGGQDMSYTGEPRLASGDGVFNASGPIADAGSAAFTANVTTFPATGEVQVRFLVQVPEDGLTDGTVLAYVWTTGTLLRWDIVYSSLGSGNLGLYIYNADGTLNSSTPSIGFDMNGKDRRLSLELTQSGANVVWQLGVIQPSSLGAGVFSATINTKSFLTVSQVQLAPLGGCSGVLFGHLTVQDDVTSLYESTGALKAHAGEVPSSSTVASSRLHRLCSEHGIALDRVASVFAINQSDADKMGPQLRAPLLELMREAEAADQGQLWDGRHAGLTYTTRRYRENVDGGTALTVSADQLAGDWAPTHDDQRIANLVTVTRLQGVSATFEDETGPRGTSIVGTYDDAETVNVLLDGMALQHAAWRVALGTQQGYRVPAVTLDLRATPALAGAVLDVVPGDRLDVEDLADVFGGWGGSADVVQLIVEGISHEITPASWRVTFQCSPFSPWGVAEVAAETGDVDPLVFRLDTDGATVATTAAAAAVSLSVATTAGGLLWTTAADDYPLYLDVGGIKVRATACSGTSSPQTMTVDALPIARAAALPVALWDPRPLGL